MKIKILLLTLLISAFSWGQAILPLTRTVQGTTSTSWMDNGTSVFACSGSDGGSTQASGEYYKVWFTATPSKLIY